MSPAGEPSSIPLTFRKAAESDCSDLVVLVDIASRGLLSWLWSSMAAPGQSPLEIGRERIRTHRDLPTYFENWHIALMNGATVGAFAGYNIPDPYDPGDIEELPDVYDPLLELEAIGAGTWHLMSLAVFPTLRGKGIGSKMIDRAEHVALSQGAATMSIMANSSNTQACSLYRNKGFAVRNKRAYVPFAGSTESGEWLLFQKPL